MRILSPNAIMVLRHHPHGSYDDYIQNKTRLKCEVLYSCFFRSQSHRGSSLARGSLRWLGLETHLM